jgi:hypothetical protein
LFNNREDYATTAAGSKIQNPKQKGPVLKPALLKSVLALGI